MAAEGVAEMRPPVAQVEWQWKEQQNATSNDYRTNAFSSVPNLGY
jgi:hypothetical protein